MNDIAAIMAGIVHVPSYFEPDMSIVASGDPEHSFLMHKLDHTLDCSLLQCAEPNDCGGTEPQGSPDPLPESNRASIRRWIAQGAKND